MAGFESLLDAETTVAGEAAPDEAATPAEEAINERPVGKILGLLIGILLVGILLYFVLGGVDNAAPEAETLPTQAMMPAPVTPAPTVADIPEMTDKQVTTPPALPVTKTRNPAAAAPETPRETKPLIGGVPPRTATLNRRLNLPRPMPTTGAKTTVRRRKQALAVPALPRSRSFMVTPLSPRPLPQVVIRLPPE